jgi:hypothetical protein
MAILYFYDAGQVTSGGTVSLMTTHIDNLDHLEGKTVAILADGHVLPQQVVVNGSVNLGDDYAKVHVGLPYVAEMETLNIEVGLPDGTLQGRRVKISQVTLRLLNSRGGYFGPNEDVVHLIRYPTDPADPLALITNDAQEILGAGYTQGGKIYLKQIDPLPITVLALIPILTPGGTTAE